MKKVLMPLAPGFEEVEALGVVDILRRAGAEVTIAGTIDGPIEGRNKIRVLADTLLESVKNSSFDLIVLPGGALGTQNLKSNALVSEIVKKHFSENRLTSAICAAPTVLSALGITKDKTITSHPSVRAELKAKTVSDERVVADGNMITSQGPGTALEFAFKLVELLYGKAKAEEVNKGVLARL